MWRSPARGLLRSLPPLPPLPPLRRHLVSQFRSQVQSSLFVSSCSVPPRSTPHFFAAVRFLASGCHPQLDEEDSAVTKQIDDSIPLSDQLPHPPLASDSGTPSPEPSGDEESLSWEDNASGVNDVPAHAELAVDEDQLESVVSLLRSTSEEPLDKGFDSIEANLSEKFAVRVFESGDISTEKLVAFYKWALTTDASVRTTRAVELLVLAAGVSKEISKKEAYPLWDLLKELGEEKGFLNTEILNGLITIFWRLEKGRAAFEVFNKFAGFGCVPDSDSHYLTIEALGTRSLFRFAWSVFENMRDSGSFPDGEKIGKVIALFCKGRMVNEAYSVYLTAKEKDIHPPNSSLDPLIDGLSRSRETVCIALELLDALLEKPSHKISTITCTSVIKGLCMIKDGKSAKRLLLKMVSSGPKPGHGAFNFVINDLSKSGDMDDAMAMLKLMKSRRVKPDIYTYTVIMSGYAKGGLMEEAREVFEEARKMHGKLSPASYHILTRGYCKMEEFGKAVEILEEMKKDDMLPNTDEYNKLIKSLCLNALDWRTAEKLVEEVKNRGVYIPEATCSLVSAVKELEEKEMALEEAKMEV